MRAKSLLTLGVAAAVLATTSAGHQTSASADVLPYRLALPGIAVDSGGSASTGSVIAGHVSARNDGGLVVTGDVTNATTGVVSNVRLLVHATVGGQAVTRETTAAVTRIAPNGISPFSARFALPGDAASGVSVDVLGFESAPAAPAATFSFAGPYPFQIGPPDPKTGVIPYSKVLEQLRGQITNTSGRPLRAIDIVVALYDGDGNVAWVGSGAELQVPFEVAGGIQQLEAGQTGTFIVGIPIGLLGSIAGHTTIQGFVNAEIQ